LHELSETKLRKKQFVQCVRVCRSVCPGAAAHAAAQGI